MAEVNTQNREQKQYIGMTENDLKGRYNMHKQSFNNSKFKNSTSLSKYIWELKKSLRQLWYKVVHIVASKCICCWLKKL